MKKVSLRKKILISITLLLSITFVFGIFNRPEKSQAEAWPIDKNVEENRDAGRDLYEGSLCHNVLPLDLKISDGTSAKKIHDENFKTAISLKKGTEIVVKSETPMYSIYILWDCPVAEWTMKIGDNTYTYGKNGFLHEYIVLPEAATELTLIMPDSASLGADTWGIYKGGMSIADIYAFPDENIPGWVQVWQPPLTDADILVVSTHADDEYIFFGGIYPIYIDQGKKVQLAYFIQHWGNRQREHEKLNGMWVAGMTNYPILSNFKDKYSTSLNEAIANGISMDDSVSFMIDTIRQCHPLAVVIHDKNGEYGHGQHRLSSAATVEAVTKTAIATINPESAALYGTWEVPKLYRHLDKENELTLDLRQPIASRDGKTAIQIARQAFLCHQSQQGYYSVDDYGQYNNSKFGLIYSTVGVDKNHNDLLENIDYTAIDALRAKASVSKTGTEADYTPIYTVDDLRLMEKDCYGKFILMRDIDMTGIDWKPFDFYGTLDGNGHALINLKITEISDTSALTYDGNKKSYDTRFAGLFAAVRHGNIHDLSLLGVNVDLDVEADVFAAGLCGYATDTVITNCTVTGDVTLKVTGKMFGVAGLIGFANKTTVDGCEIDVTLVNIDKDAVNKDEQFTGGVLATGYINVTNTKVNIKGYTSDHGYVHDGGIVGMYFNYDGSTTKGTIKNNTVNGFIRFFEDNKDRRAYCKDTIGENLSKKYTTVESNTTSFKSEEVKEFDKDLLPHECSGNKFSPVANENDTAACGPVKTEYMCDECKTYTYAVYSLKKHNVTKWENIIEPTYTTEGLGKGHCADCDTDVYEILEVLPLPTPTPTDTPVPTATPAPTNGTDGPTTVPAPDGGAVEPENSGLFNTIIIVVCIIVIAVVFAFLPAIVKKRNK